MKRILVIQLARLGDTLQSLMALRAAKHLYPDLKITMVVRDRFSGAATRVGWIDEVVPFPAGELIGPHLGGRESEKETIRRVAKWLAPLVREPWDLVVNWSYSEASSFLTALVPGAVKLGYTRRQDLSISCADAWSQYVHAIVQGDVDQNIHLTDILTTQLLTALQIHAGEPKDTGDSPVTSKTFFRLDQGDRDAALSLGDPSRRWVGIQLGASREDRAWPVASWAALAELMIGRHPDVNIALLGGAEDVDKSAEFKRILASRGADVRRVVSLAGKTDFDLWASIVGRCHWIAGTDTAVIHLASVLGTRVLNLSVGPVKWAETGPYGNGHYVVAPRERGGILLPETVYAAWSYAAGEWLHQGRKGLERWFERLGYGELRSGAQIYRSRIRKPSDGGGVVYEALLPHPMGVAEWTAMVMGQVARAWYCGWVPPTGHELDRKGISADLVRDLRGLGEGVDVMRKVCREGTSSAGRLSSLASGLRSDRVMSVSNREEIDGAAKKLRDLDILIERLGRAQRPLLGFSRILRVMMHNLRGARLHEIAKESAISYQQLADGADIMKEWIEHTIVLAKPIPVRAPELVAIEGGAT